jgi:hypothetical protein
MIFLRNRRGAPYLIFSYIKREYLHFTRLTKAKEKTKRTLIEILSPHRKGCCYTLLGFDTHHAKLPIKS